MSLRGKFESGVNLIQATRNTTPDGASFFSNRVRKLVPIVILCVQYRIFERECHSYALSLVVSVISSHYILRRIL